MDVVAVALMLVLLGAVGGWIAGWIGRGEQNRLFAVGQQRYVAEQQAQRELIAVQAEQQPSPAVVHVHLALPAPYQGWAPQVIDAQVVQALEARDE